MKKVFSGIIIGVVLSISFSAYATEIKSLVGQAIQGTFPVKVNGEVLQNEAIVLDGTSYLPVREISEKLGMEVKFSNEDGIELNKQEAAMEEPKEEVPVISAPEPKWTKERIDIAISSQKNLIEIRETSIRFFVDATPAEKAQMQKELQEAQDRLAELEKIKAELEK